MKRTGRYFIANENNIPLHAQPENGYTWLQAISRAQREIEECIRLFGGSFDDYKCFFSVLDSSFKEVPEARDCF